MISASSIPIAVSVLICVQLLAQQCRVPERASYMLLLGHLGLVALNLSVLCLELLL